MLFCPHIHYAFGKGRRGHNQFTDFVFCNQLVFGSGFDHKDVAVLAGEIDSTICRDGGGAKPAAGVANPLAVLFFAGLQIIAIKHAVVVERIEIIGYLKYLTDFLNPKITLPIQIVHFLTKAPGNPRPRFGCFYFTIAWR